ncbi:hypothetical protein DdX_02606 [Ditylenchus destructor]|uniref:Uncharacterized protein n=1 Tax=Ditylenchus destructor TaxID=166010 RepID=A0AAD4NBJ0_9BILA|nr:hypothetical protein DdX_02606 [Ditylenchus destructor]
MTTETEKCKKNKGIFEKKTHFPDAYELIYPQNHSGANSCGSQLFRHNTSLGLSSPESGVLEHPSRENETAHLKKFYRVFKAKLYQAWKREERTKIATRGVSEYLDIEVSLQVEVITDEEKDILACHAQQYKTFKTPCPLS